MAYTALPGSVTHDLVKRLVALATAPDDAATITTRAPYDDAVIAELPQLTAGDVPAIFETARAAQHKWAAMTIHERAKIFLTFHDLVVDNKELIMDLIQAENGKTRRDALNEVLDIMNTARYYGRVAKELLKPKGRTGVVPGLTQVTEHRHPKGVVSIISPWNYPFTLGVGDTIPALIAGNAVVQKPDNQTALCALIGLELALAAGLPQGVWQIVLGRGSQIGTPLIDGADYVMFTGSTPSGRVVAEQAGRRLIGCSLELGGKNAMIVLDDADLDRAVAGAVSACFSNSGQLCISIERMYVQDGIHDEFVARFVQAVHDMKVGAGYDYGYDMGSLTSQDQVAAITKHVEDAVAQGATVLAGGNAMPEVGPLFFEPTVLTDVTPDMACFADETFGPLVSIYKFSEIEDAIARANDTPYGLNASVWTKSVRRGDEIASRMKSGTVNINEAYAAAWGSVDAPMGGMGDSGLGRRHGSEGMLKYTESQTHARQRLMNIAPVGPMTHDHFDTLLTGTLGALKKIGWK